MGTFHLALGGRLLPQEHPLAPQHPLCLVHPTPSPVCRSPGRPPAAPGAGVPAGLLMYTGVSALQERGGPGPLLPQPDAGEPEGEGCVRGCGCRQAGLGARVQGV